MKKKFKRILVTGGAGCIGIQVCKELAKNKKRVVLFDLKERIKVVKDEINSEYIETFNGSIMSMSDLKKASINCDAIIHLAAYLGVNRTEKNKLKCLDINIVGTRNIVDLIDSMKKIKKIIFASSSEVYGEPLKNPVNENSLTQGKTVYAISKLAGEELVKSICEIKKVRFTIIRYFNTYGPYQVKQFVISKFIDLIKKNKSPIINGNGKQLRSYNYSKDSAKATVDCLLSDKLENKVINIGNDSSKINLINLVKLINKILKKNIKPKLNLKFKKTDRSHNREINVRYCDINLAKKKLGYRPKYSLEMGIREMIKISINPSDWVLEDKPNSDSFYDLNE